MQTAKQPDKGTLTATTRPNEKNNLARPYPQSGVFDRRQAGFVTEGNVAERKMIPGVLFQWDCVGEVLYLRIHIPEGRETPKASPNPMQPREKLYGSAQWFEEAKHITVERHQTSNGKETLDHQEPTVAENRHTTGGDDEHRNKTKLHFCDASPGDGSNRVRQATHVATGYLAFTTE
jgi:hypothetical protein